MNTKPVVLIVDDITTNLQALALLLKETYTIKIATNGHRAIELMNQEPIPDLILLDIEMPEMNGYEVCKILKQHASTAYVPIIFVTAKDSITDEEYGLEIGAVDYIVKPYRPAIVKARVKTHITLKQQHDTLALMAKCDNLTGLYNRHYLNEEGIGRISRAKRHKEPMSCIILDIDHFKRINDTHGHLTGDVILTSIANLLKSFTRKEDIVARYGGEEFVIILDKCDQNSAFIKADKLRHEIELLHPNDITVTASFGIAELDPSMNTLDDILKHADSALYHSKEHGRNQVNSYKKAE